MSDVIRKELAGSAVIHIGPSDVHRDLFERVLHLVKDPEARRLPPVGRSAALDPGADHIRRSRPVSSNHASQLREAVGERLAARVAREVRFRIERRTLGENERPQILHGLPVARHGTGIALRDHPAHMLVRGRLQPDRQAILQQQVKSGRFLRPSRPGWR